MKATSDLAGLHRAYFHLTGQIASYSSWYNRLNKAEFTIFSKKCFNIFNERLHLNLFSFTKSKLLNKFSDIYIQDGSSVSLNSILAKTFPGRFTKTNPAAIEIHAFFSLCKNKFINLEMSADKESEYHYNVPAI